MMRWSVGFVAEGDEVVSLAEVVELADAVAAKGGIATGGNAQHYGAQLVVEADSRDEAIEKGRIDFHDAVRVAGLPPYPIVRIEAVSEVEDAMEGP